MAEITNGKIDYMYVFGTFEECDVEGRLDENVLEYIRENDLMYGIVQDAVDWMRDWIDCESDAFYEALSDALRKNIGAEKLRELEC